MNKTKTDKITQTQKTRCNILKSLLSSLENLQGGYEIYYHLKICLDDIEGIECTEWQFNFLLESLTDGIDYLIKAIDKLDTNYYRNMELQRIQKLLATFGDEKPTLLNLKWWNKENTVIK